MTGRGYREEELVTNRASLLLSGGTEDERRAWAQEAAEHFAAEGPLVEARTAAELAQALKAPRGVVFIPDVGKLAPVAQAQLLRCLQLQEERPKVVVGLAGSPDQARTRGTLREDLHYRLHQALVDMNTEGLRDALKKRRAQAAAERAARAAKLKASAPAPQAASRTGKAAGRKVLAHPAASAKAAVRSAGGAARSAGTPARK
ncbi:Fis family transcriptional regulator [Aggregicoccus sp. 17bor-14]|uniref:Fis family transcriptional regulator n=1 Tax=Myxococcaceae TaxID=31 RepID=UPI00129C1373|nr:Fis family transcriptional regulator [Simulacricoccus sp. 17bor-14]MRI91118.1 Fis family transcriptional regulator [Aggregicoccus sp. 17bor-14]